MSAGDCACSASDQGIMVVCRCADANLLPENWRDLLPDFDGELVVVPDLCELVQRKDPLLARVAAAGRIAVAACHPRAVRWLFDAAGAALPADAVTIDLRPEGDAPAAAKQPGAWFPVIDRDRCEECGKCLDFCLFGVYAGNSSGAVEVRNPQNCKAGCPACARVCPQVAVIFPKYAKAPVNGGTITDLDAAREKVAVDLDRLFDGDVRDVLAQRKRRKLLRGDARRQPPEDADPPSAQR